ncbi:hypothetical protein [Psychrobacter sp. UBA2514]|jgi:hypothetical protein|uniref:hypothetical protein n=1 Tax=Psychrobacter sp. UBA2514 TaxID=1947346 RepID=UPI00257F46AB|nr:hypothetical protein [Psychrobacter sp. UBA2514]|tara:strand:+ start:7840 stop:8445 length:606 start_codon:yes stop_codon:yes gene_type:complete
MGFVKDAFDSITGKSAAKSASKAQQQATEKGMEEQRRQFDIMQQLMQPYVDQGAGALQGQNDLLGLNGFDSQQSAITNIENSPFFKSQYQMAENALLQNAAATGGLRGGNTQEALADNRSNMLYNNVQQQLQNLSGVASNGQSAAAGLGGQGLQFGNNIAQGYGDIGQAQAGYQLAKGQINQGLLGFGLKAGASALGFGGF